MSNATNSKIALVLGATGGIGGAVADNLINRGWQVRALNRKAATAAEGQPHIDWRQGDAMVAGDVLAAAQGVDVIVHAVNPPGYRNWGELVLPMLDNTIAAAHAVGATILLPGTVYNFGPDAFPVLREDSPQNPRTRKGAIRVEMEARLKIVAEKGMRVIIVRAGDFFGPGANNNWFSQGLITAGKPVKSVMYPGKTGTGHQWAYLPDVAEIMARLIERGDVLPDFAVYHMNGVWDADGRRMIAAIERAVGHKVKVRSFPWWSLPLLAPFVEFFSELREMRYLWAEPLRMDNAALVQTLGEEPHTPIDIAVRNTLIGCGCIEETEPSNVTKAIQLMFFA
ncbi:MAG: family NAD(P)-dependent oxidoreductase [Rhizobium sp.]|nr:family NAD(P)-dependent oxidoreductase [Rhizobium sp.]